MARFFRQRERASVKAWRQQGTRIMSACDSKEHKALYVTEARDGPLFAVLSTVHSTRDGKGCRCRQRVLAVDENLKDLLESSDMFSQEIMDVHPSWSKHIAKVATELAGGKDWWSSFSRMQLPWSWQRMLHLGLALPTRLTLCATSSNEQIQEELQGWHEAILTIEAIGGAGVELPQP